MINILENYQVFLMTVTSGIPPTDQTPILSVISSFKTTTIFSYFSFPPNKSYPKGSHSFTVIVNSKILI